MGKDRTSFGKYQVLARLGQGGMGHVYLALHLGPAGVEKLIVVKQLREDFASSVAARSMFLDEARISTRLNHPNIVQTIEVVDAEELYLVMEFLDGQPLSRILDPMHSAAFPLGAKLRILIAALEGLHYAHEPKDYDGRPLRVVHRDVSPQNIIVTYDGHVKLVDFGVAKAADATSVTESGMFKGKVRYASPEQALCAGVDRRADVFAVGTILWEMLSGRRMWQDQADASVLLALASGQLPRIRDAVPSLPPALEAICAKALAGDAGGRYATALELRNALQEFVRDAKDETDLGATLSAAFSSDRRSLHALIDAQVKETREASSGGARTLRNIPLVAEAAGSLGSLISEKSMLRSGLSVEPQSRRAGPTSTPKSTSWIAAAALVGVLGVIGGVALLLPSRRGTATPSTADRHVHLSLHAYPPDAHFVLDGTPLDANPYDAEVARDDVPHHLAIRADGFDERELETAFSRDVSLDAVLTPRTPPAPTAAAPLTPTNIAVTTAVAPARPPQGTRATPPARTPQRRMDEEDPYKQ